MSEPRQFKKKPTLALVTTYYKNKSFINHYSKWLDQYHHYFDLIIIVDDCSPKGEQIILQSISKNFDQAIFVKTDTNSGRPSIPRNLALDIILEREIDKVMFHDVDDCISEKYIIHCKNSNASLISGVKYRTSNPYTKFENCGERLFKSLNLSKRLFNLKNVATLSGATVKTTIIKNIRFENVPLEDWLFWQKISQKENFRNFEVVIGATVAYFNEVTLSPRKTKQLIRIKSRTGLMQFIGYLVITMLLFATETLNRYNVTFR